MTTYLDTSAAMKLLVEQPESAALVTDLVEHEASRDLVASWLLHTELHCAANRRADDIGLEDVATVLRNVSLVDLTRGDLLTAGALPGRLRSQDAIHLTVALRLGASQLITYDDELATAGLASGLQVLSPR